MNVKPIGERALLKVIEVQEKTSSGIILSSSSNDNNKNIAEVIAIGNGEKLKGISVGMKVIYSKYSGTELKDNNDTLLIVNAEDILAIID